MRYIGQHYCKRCKEWKMLTKKFFYLKKDGSYSDCKACFKTRNTERRRERQRIIYKTNRESKIKYNAAYRTADKDKEYHRRSSSELSDAYVIKILCMRLGITSKEVKKYYPELIPVYRVQLKIKRNEKQNARLAKPLI